jgi:hypothetical protein
MMELANGQYGEILTKLIKMHSCNNSNVHCDIMLLRSLCIGMERFCGFEIGRNQLVQVEAHTILLQIMKEYLTNIEIIRPICLVLANMALLGPDQKVKISGGINGCKLFVHVLKMHGNDAIVVTIISALLQNLTAYCPVNKRQLTEAGFHEALLCAIKEHRDNPQLGGVLFRALPSLTIDNETVKLLSNQGACELWVEITRRDPTNVDLANSSFIVNFALNADNRVKVIDAGGCELMLTVLRTHPENGVIVQWTCAALGTLVLNTLLGSFFADYSSHLSLAHKQFRDQGGCELLVEKLRHYREHIKVVGAVTFAISKYSVDVDNRTRFINAGCVELLSEIWKRYPDHDDAKHAKQAFQNLGAPDGSSEGQCILC